jgi:hypothetical protein
VKRNGFRRAAVNLAFGIRNPLENRHGFLFDPGGQPRSLYHFANLSERAPMCMLVPAMLVLMRVMMSVAVSVARMVLLAVRMVMLIVVRMMVMVLPFPVVEGVIVPLPMGMFHVDVKLDSFDAALLGAPGVQVIVLETEPGQT